MEAKIAFVPNVSFDFVLYSRESGPIVLSAKTSLRERYKQADLEAFVLKNVHRKSQTILITNNYDEAKSIDKKISSSDVMGIDRVVVATDKGFSKIIKGLKEYTFITPENIEIITSSRIIKG